MKQFLRFWVLPGPKMKSVYGVPPHVVAWGMVAVVVVLWQLHG